MSARDGGPAFPQPNEQLIDEQAWTAVKHMPDGPERHKAIMAERARLVGGMSLRDYFAAKALPMAWMAEHKAPTHGASGEATYQGVAERAYLMADAMLAAREATP